MPKSDDIYTHEEWEESLPQASAIGVTVVAVTNFVAGGLAIAAGLMLIVWGVGGLTQAQALLGNTNMDDKDRAIIDLAYDLLMALGGVSAAFGLLGVCAGVGVLQRQAWGRMLSLILGFLSAALAVFCMISLLIPGVVLYGSYAMIMLLVLFDPDYAKRFR